MSQFRGIRDSIKSIVPKWLANRLNRNNGFKLLYSIALSADTVVEVMLEGFRAALPGKGTDTALPFIGQSRGLIQGTGESNAAYALRLQQWLATWQNAGSDETLIQLIQLFLGPDINGTPTVRVVDRRGNFVSISPSGVISKVTDTTWNWDSISNPERLNFWSDIWIIVYVAGSRWPEYTSLTDPNWIAAWGGKSFGEGHEVTRDIIDGVMRIIADFKGAHTYVQAVIVSTDTTLFVPGSLAASGNPNGKWGNFSYAQPAFNGKLTASPIRTTDTGGGFVRYWCPPQGG